MRQPKSMKSHQEIASGPKKAWNFIRMSRTKIVKKKSIKAFKDISYRPKSTKSQKESMQQNAANFKRTSHNSKKAWNLIRKSRKNGPWECTQSPAFFNTTSLPSLHHIITTNPKPPTEPSNHTIAWVHVTSSHILHFTYSLTVRHIGNFCDVPLIEVSVEGVSRTKHCRKKRRPITFTVNEQEKKAEVWTLVKILWQPK